MSNIERKCVAMIIDDDEMDQFFHHKTINDAGIFSEIISFYYAADALEYLKDPNTCEIDVIFLDINMPRMNGFEFLEAAYAEFGDSFAKVVVVMVTSSLDPQDLENANKYNVVKEYINKPISVEAVQNIGKLLPSWAFPEKWTEELSLFYSTSEATISLILPFNIS